MERLYSALKNRKHPESSRHKANASCRMEGQGEGSDRTVRRRNTLSSQPSVSVPSTTPRTSAQPRAGSAAQLQPQPSSSRCDNMTTAPRSQVPHTKPIYEAGSQRPEKIPAHELNQLPDAHAGICGENPEDRHAPQTDMEVYENLHL